MIEGNEVFKKTVHFKKVHCPANHVIVKENEIHNEIFFIIRGGVRVSSKGAVGDNKLIKPGLSDLAAGDVFGEFCLFDDEPASATVIAVEDTDLYEVDSSTLKKFIHENPELGLPLLWEMASILVKRIRHSNKAVVDLLIWGLKVHKIDKDL
jgi:CRP-like cAMP-binding protein